MKWFRVGIFVMMLFLCCANSAPSHGSFREKRTVFLLGHLIKALVIKQAALDLLMPPPPPANGTQPAPPPGAAPPPPPGGKPPAGNPPPPAPPAPPGPPPGGPSKVSLPIAPAPAPAGKAAPAPPAPPPADPAPPAPQSAEAPSGPSAPSAEDSREEEDSSGSSEMQERMDLFGRYVSNPDSNYISPYGNEDNAQPQRGSVRFQGFSAELGGGGGGSPRAQSYVKMHDGYEFTNIHNDGGRSSSQPNRYLYNFYNSAPSHYQGFQSHPNYEPAFAY